MKPAYIFDVDGTLTPSRGVITDEFHDFFVSFAENNDVYLVSGSDYVKTVEQLGIYIVEHLVVRSYNCSGNSVWETGREIRSNNFELDSGAKQYLLYSGYTSQCPTKTGNHLELRPGSANFSTVGRNANAEQRAEYVAFDSQTNERQKIAEGFNQLFGGRYVATIGGETGIDITYPGKDKRQILEDFVGRTVYFFGDKLAPGGNDYPLAQAIIDRNRPEDRLFAVQDWQDTLAELKKLTV